MKQKHGGKRENAGRKETGRSTKLVRVPITLLDQVNKLIEAHKERTKPQAPIECGCEVIGHTAAGRAIVRRCIKHR